MLYSLFGNASCAKTYPGIFNILVQKDKKMIRTSEKLVLFSFFTFLATHKYTLGM